MLNKLNIVTERVGFPGGSVGKEILGQENPLEKDIATHSSILPGKSHRQRSLAAYSPQRLQRVGLDLVTEHAPRTIT